MFNVYSLENQNFYLNNSLISGIENLTISYENNTSPSLYINDDNQNYFITKPITADLDLSYILNSNDSFLNYTGTTPFSGKVEYGNKNFTFSSGYLTSYSIGYKLGEYPRVNIKSVIFGELGNTSGVFTPSPIFSNNFIPADNYYVDFNLNEANLNRLESFDLNINVPREAIYTIGNYLPDDVIINYPISITLNLEFSISEYNQNKITDLFTGISQRNLNLSFRRYGSDISLLRFNLSNLVDAQTELNYSINNDAKLKLALNTYILSGA